jgi:predicted RNA-binding protein YlxR (DUF448 family)
MVTIKRPIRTCIGCRERASAAELLRVVVAPDANGAGATPDRPPDGPQRIPPVVPDPRRRLPGRGAWLHRDLQCAELAQRRRAYARALRMPGPVDPAPVLGYLAPQDGQHTVRSQITSGNPQES